MLSLKANFDQKNANQHQCIGHQEGDWIYFTCQQCDYQRQMNWKTGEMKVKANENSALHTGQHIPVQAKQSALLINHNN